MQLSTLFSSLYYPSSLFSPQPNIPLVRPLLTLSHPPILSLSLSLSRHLRLSLSISHLPPPLTSTHQQHLLQLDSNWYYTESTSGLQWNNDSLGRPERKNTQSKGDWGGPAKYSSMIKLVLFWKIRFQLLRNSPRKKLTLICESLYRESRNGYLLNNFLKICGN